MTVFDFIISAVCFGYQCGVFWLLSPSPNQNPEIDNKQTEVRLLMSIM